MLRATLNNYLTIKNIAIAIFFIFLLIQCILLYVFRNLSQLSDNICYIELAQKCFEQSSWYPSSSDIYSNYIWAPGLINYYILQLKLFGTISYNGLLNLFLNVGIFIEIWYLAKYFFSERIAYISLILNCLLYSNLIGILIYGTEIPFLFLALAGLCLCTQKKTWAIILGGIALSFSNTVRPLAILFIITIILFFVTKRNNWKKNVLVFISSYLLVTIIFGSISWNRTGYFTYQSTTSGINLVMTAIEGADGLTSTGSKLVETNPDFCAEKIKNLTFKQRDSLFMNTAITWIKSHPLEYIKLYIKKIPLLYMDDTWPERLMTGKGLTDSLHDSNSKTNYILSIILKNLSYYICCFVFLLYIIRNRRNLISFKNILIFLLITGTLMTCLFASMPRYHYPFLFIIVIYAAAELDYRYNELNLRKIRHKVLDNQPNI